MTHSTTMTLVTTTSPVKILHRALKTYRYSSWLGRVGIEEEALGETKLEPDADRRKSSTGMYSWMEPCITALSWERATHSSLMECHRMRLSCKQKTLTVGLLVTSILSPQSSPPHDDSTMTKAAISAAILHNDQNSR